MDAEEQPRRIDDIKTDWSRLGDPALFVIRYSRAIRSYLSAMLRHADDVDEVSQQFMLGLVKRGFRSARFSNGRLRDYLKASLRNAVRTFYRRRVAQRTLLDQVPRPAETGETNSWLDEWRRCVLDRVWDALAAHQQRTPGNLAFTILMLQMDFPDESSEDLLERLAKRTGKSLRPDAYRKQLSRARRLFAMMLVDEVSATVHPRTEENIIEELADLGLLKYVREFLPAGDAE